MTCMSKHRIPPTRAEKGIANRLPSARRRLGGGLGEKYPPLIARRSSRDEPKEEFPLPTPLGVCLVIDIMQNVKRARD